MARSSARGQSTLSAQAAHDSSLDFIGATLPGVLAGSRAHGDVPPAATPLSLAEETERWLAHRRAAEHASDGLTLREVTGLKPTGTLSAWQQDFSTSATPAASESAESISYACAGRLARPQPANASTVAWAAEVETWLANKRAAEAATDHMLAQEMVWWKP